MDWDYGFEGTTFVDDEKYSFNKSKKNELNDFFLIIIIILIVQNCQMLYRHTVPAEGHAIRDIQPTSDIFYILTHDDYK